MEVLLEEGGLFARARAMIEPVSRSATEAGRAALMHDAGANAARQAFNDALRALKARIEASAFPDIMEEQRLAVMQLLSQVAQLGAEAGLQQLEVLQQTLLDSRLRQQELVKFALDEAGLHALLGSFPGKIERLEPLKFENGELAGWALIAVRD